MEVRRRLIEEDVRRQFEAKGDLAFAHHGGFGHAGFGGRMPFLCEERKLSPPLAKPKHKLQLLEIEPSGRPEVCALTSSEVRLF
jgi:hypothetical protein